MKNHSCVCLFYCSPNMMRWILPLILFFTEYLIHISNLWSVSYLAKGFCFFPLPVFHILLYRGLSLPYCSQGETLNYTYKLFADDLQQAKEEKEIGSHLNDYLQCLLKYGLGFPWREAAMNLLSLISGEQFIIVKAEGGVHIVFEVFKSLSILALLKSKNLQRIINCWACLI